MKTLIQMLSVVAFAAAAVPAFADNSTATKTDMDPKTMTCTNLAGLDAAGQTSVALLVKTALADDATVAAMSDADLTAEVLKRCGSHPDSIVLDAFKM